ncbi:MAG: ParB/RepB/Spo0J family partition protein [Acidobacteriota bacterium]|jgi:ParB family chromosome partitioning protein
MRHDAHFVEALTSDRGAPIGRMIAVDRLEPNPEQPRRDFGDLQDLVSSVKEKGVLAPILVRQIGPERYQIIAGERRYRASLEAGLQQVPIIEMEVDERGVLEISLIENLQRRDLSPFEEADAVALLADRYGYTHESLARKLGRSRSTVTELLALARIPEEIRLECRRADIVAKSTLLEVAKCGDADTMRRLLDHLAREGAGRELAREAQRSRPAKGKPFVFRYQPEDRRFRIQLRFAEEEVGREEMIAAVRELLRTLEGER